MQFDIHRSWRLLLLEEEAIRHYPQAFLLHGFSTHRDVLLDRLLPSLFYIRAVVILDDGLEEAMGRRNLSLPSGKQNSLKNRIDFLENRGVLSPSLELNRIRGRRNELAHETGRDATWDELKIDRAMIQQALLDLDLIRPAKKLDFYSERSAMRGTSKEGYTLERDYEYGVRENGKPALEIRWSEYIE